MGALISALFGRLFTVEVAKFLAYKVLLSFLVFTGLVIVYQLIISLTLDWVSSLLSDYASDSSVVLQLSGVAGWILSKLRVDDCISMLLSAMSVRLALRMLPLSPVK